MKPNKNTFKKYATHFDEIALFEKIKLIAGKAGNTVVYYALVLYFMLLDKTVPARNKLVIVAALGYFILPTDLIADIIPVFGFSDDIAFLTYALSSLNDFISPEVITKAKLRLGMNNPIDELENK